jgi:CheY-like chemotaxis protein
VSRIIATREEFLEPLERFPFDIVLAYDHDGICEMVQSVLSTKGYHILVTRNGEEAVEIFSAHRDRISPIPLDVIMPRRSGPEAFAAIKALRSDVSVLFAIGYSNKTALLADLAERGVVVLRKPYSPPRFAAASGKSWTQPL